MIFDIPASIGNRRMYLLKDGKGLLANDGLSSYEDMTWAYKRAVVTKKSDRITITQTNNSVTNYTTLVYSNKSYNLADFNTLFFIIAGNNAIDPVWCQARIGTPNGTTLDTENVYVSVETDEYQKQRVKLDITKLSDKSNITIAIRFGMIATNETGLCDLFDIYAE